MEDNAEYVLVCLCVNDDNGNFTGRVIKIDIEDGCEMFCELEHARFYEDDGGETVKIDHAFLVIGNRHFDIEPGSHATWVGNMAWDAVRMEIGAAKLLVEDLLTSGDWSEEVTTEGWGSMG